MILLKRQFNWELNHLFDTMWAARILGYKRYGLASLIAHFFDILKPGGKLGIVQHMADPEQDWMSRNIGYVGRDYIIAQAQGKEAVRIDPESPAAERLAAFAGASGPKPSNTSPCSAAVASSRSVARGA